MADDKKNDEYIEMPSVKEFRAPSPTVRPSQKSHSSASVTESPLLSILAYCGSSILMTTTNKYVLSGVDFNLNFFLLAVQVRFPVRTRPHPRSSLTLYTSPLSVSPSFLL
jgi:GDP-mannose transporter